MAGHPPTSNALPETCGDEPWADTETGGLNRRDISALSGSLGSTTAVRKGLTCQILH